MTRRHRLFAASTGLAALVLTGFALAQGPAAKKASTNPQSVPAQVDAVFAAWDVDRNGTLSLQEFHNGWTLLRRAGEMQERLRAQFRTIDANRNGGIDAGEYANLVLVKKAGNAAPLLSAFDANKDQRLEYPEYLEFVRHMAQSPQPQRAVGPLGKSP